MFEKITSPQNPKVKNVLHLEKASERRKQNLFIAEGFREVKLAFDAGFNFKYTFFCPEINNSYEYQLFIRQASSQSIVYEVTRAVFEKVAYRENSDGILAIAEAKYLKLADIVLTDNPFIIVLEKVEKPGNLGAVLRTADAAKVDAVLVCDPQTDIYNPNAIRSGIGCVFTNQVVCCTSEEALLWLRNKKIKNYAAALTAEAFYHETSFVTPSAIIMGTEADGLTEFWLKNADAQIKIPMRGEIDSLNVSTATAIITFEAMRQRGFK